MRCSRTVVGWLDRAESWGVRPELIGDLHEEVLRGRSQAWLCGQLLSTVLVAGTVLVRDRVQTPSGIRDGVLGLAVLATVIVPTRQLLQTWLVVYYLAGMLSLFAHMAASEPHLTRDVADQ